MIHIKYDSFSFISVCFISTIRYITNLQWPALQLARLAQWIERPVMAKGQGSIPGQAWIFQILFEPLRSLILLRRSCSLSMLQFVWKSQVRLVQSLVEFQYWSGLNYERSPFFLSPLSETHARDTKMTTRVTEGGGCARAHSPLLIWRERLLAD